MQTEQPQTILLKDYTPPHYFAKKVSLSFDLSPSQTQVKAIVSYVHSPSQDRSLRLHGNNLQLLTVAIDNKNIPLDSLDYGPDYLQLEHLPTSFDLELITQINPQANLALEGLYLSQNKYYTQCEPEGFRRITYFLDRPDVMAVYDTTIIAAVEQCPVLLSNGNLINQGKLPDGKHFATWQDPFPKPSYLFALVAGELSRVSDKFVTQSGRTIDIHIYVEQENINKCAFALDAVKRAMRWDEKVYGLEYDLDLFMIVAVSDFNMGAMENKGLNIFNAKYILASPETATDDDFEKILAVVGHEYFHNWTGNRVTLRDWFQLSLKEGLTVFRDQEFSADEGSRAVKRISDVKLLREQQFAEDGGPMAHAVRPDNYIEINNFYTSTVYNKGAEVIRMLHTSIGPKIFRSAMDLFFKTYDGQAVTVENFLAVVEVASQRSLSQFKLWYQQAGTPRVAIERNYDSKSQTLTLKISQALANSPKQTNKKPQVIPLRLALLSHEGKALQSKFQDQLAHEHLLLLDAEETEFTFHAVQEPPIPSLGRNFSAPVIIDAKLADSELYTLLRWETDPFNKYEAAQTLALRIMKGHLAASVSVKESALDPDYIAGFRHMLNDTKNDPRLVALSMQLPSSDYLVNQEVIADLDAIFQARIWLLEQLASVCKAELLDCYQRTRAKTFSLDREAIGQRDLNNACLIFLAHANNADTIALTQQHFSSSTNMTDTMGALTAQAHLDSPVRTQCLESFYTRWRHTPLVIDKWFQVQASSQHPHVLAQVRTLLQHPDFDIHNPNRVYSIFRPFNKANPYGFHHSSGEGYALVADYVERIDKTNPQVAAMLSQGLSRFRKFDLDRQQQMRKQLERLKANPQVSRDVFEVVQKSLAGA